MKSNVVGYVGTDLGKSQLAVVMIDLNVSVSKDSRKFSI